MAPDALNDLLNAVAPARRQFLKTILTGTAFAAPLMASFSMDGLSVDAAPLALCGNLTLSSNMSVSSFAMDPFTCSNASNMTALSSRRGPMFKATLKDGQGRRRGMATFELNDDRCAIEYRLNLTGKLETVNYGTIGVPAAVLVISITSPPAEYVLSAGRGEIGVALRCLPDLVDVQDAFRHGQAEVIVKTPLFEAQGTVQPA
jgi:hypothetical protein